MFMELASLSLLAIYTLVETTRSTTYLQNNQLLINQFSVFMIVPIVKVFTRYSDIHLRNLELKFKDAVSWRVPRVVSRS
jgi:hypothetical protein